MEKSRWSKFKDWHNRNEDEIYATVFVTMVVGTVAAYAFHTGRKVGVAQATPVKGTYVDRDGKRIGYVVRSAAGWDTMLWDKTQNK